MQANRAMRELLKRYGVDLSSVPPMDLYPIRKKVDETGRPYWGVWDMDKQGASARTALSWQEWDGNETYLSTDDPGKIQEVLTHTIGILKAWKETLFCLFFNFDDGSLQEPDPGKEPYRGTFARFWAIREGEKVLDYPNLEELDEPALMEKWNVKRPSEMN